ncbi:MAG: carboxypeptidase-like regulatory domain-containing protein [Vicinamibacterales bacterium]
MSAFLGADPGAVDVSADTTWESSAPGILSVDASGWVEALEKGSASLRAAYRSAMIDVPAEIAPLSVPVSGIVRETAPTTDLVVAGADVVAMSHGREVARATTDARGTFAFTLDRRVVDLAVEKPGYEPVSVRTEASGASLPDVFLSPVGVVVESAISGRVCAPYACPRGQYPPVATFPLPIHHDGAIRLQVLEWTHDHNERVYATIKGCSGESVRITAPSLDLSAPIPVQGGCLYRLEISFLSGVYPYCEFLIRLQRPS